MGPQSVGGNRIALGWTLAIICWILALIMLVPTDNTLSQQDREMFLFCCCSGFVPLIMVISGRGARRRAQVQFMQSQIATSYPSIEQQRMMAQQNMMAQQQIDG